MRVDVGPASELKDGDRKFVTVEGQEIAVVNFDGDYYAIRNFCPHMEGPLARGYISTKKKNGEEVNFVSCPFHEWEFDIETGQALFNDTHNVRTYETFVEGGMLYIEV
jgi:NAD(P)H-dependent nitrite reductase small subunit